MPTRKGSHLSVETRAKMSAVRKGRTRSAAHSAAISAALKASPKAKAQLASVRGRGGRARTQAKLYALEKARSVRNARLAAMTLSQRREMMRPVTIAGQTVRESSIEKTVRAVLESLGVEFIRQHPIGRYFADFYVPAKRLVIECDGEYWHRIAGRPERDARRDKWMTVRGYIVLRLAERQIKGGESREILKLVV